MRAEENFNDSLLVVKLLKERWGAGNGAVFLSDFIIRIGRGILPPKMNKKIKLAKNISSSNLKLPFDYFENHFQDMKPVCIKVLLYILYLCTLGDIEWDEEEMAKKLRLTVDDISKSFDEIIEYGFMTQDAKTGELEIVGAEDFYRTYKRENKDGRKKEVKEIIKVISEDATYKKRIKFIEEVYKELNPNEYLEIYDLLETQKVPYEVLLAAIDYSNSKGGGKKNINYISKIAINWKELGLTNYESCERYISGEGLQEDARIKELKHLFKLDRDFFEVELIFIEQWISAGKSAKDIREAMELTVLNTGKLSFPYMNAILINGKKDVGKKTGKKTTMHNFTEREYNFDEILTSIRKKQNK